MEQAVLADEDDEDLVSRRDLAHDLAHVDGTDLDDDPTEVVVEPLGATQPPNRAVSEEVAGEEQAATKEAGAAAPLAVPGDGNRAELAPDVAKHNHVDRLPHVRSAVSTVEKVVDGRAKGKTFTEAIINDCGYGDLVPTGTLLWYRPTGHLEAEWMFMDRPEGGAASDRVLFAMGEDKRNQIRVTVFAFVKVEGHHGGNPVLDGGGYLIHEKNGNPVVAGGCAEMDIVKRILAGSFGKFPAGTSGG